jgi:hypothetical protein
MISISVCGIGAAQVIASFFGFGLPCMYHATTGQPCPGCGLTRSIMALLRGNFRDSFLLHPMGPLLLVGLAACLVSIFLPARLRSRLVAAMARLETATALIPVLFVLLMLIWVLRITGLVPLAPV